MKCLRCDAILATKQNYIKHMNRKVPCEPLELSIEHPSINEYKCPTCNLVFNSKFNLERHQNFNVFCQIMKSNMIINNQQINQISQQINQQINQINQINQYITTPTPIPVPVTFVKHGFETIDHITKDLMLQLLNKRFDIMCSDLVKELYFNKKVPENNNWTIAYPKDKKAGLAFNDDTYKFERTSTEDLIDDKFSNMITLLQPLIEEILKEDEATHCLNNRQRYNVSMFYHHFGMMQISKEDTELYKVIHELAYRYKSIPMANWKEQGLSGNHLSIKFE